MKVIPVLAAVMTEIGSLSLPLEEYSDHVPGKHTIAELQTAFGLETEIS
jgi:hypothetical protein